MNSFKKRRFIQSILLFTKYTDHFWLKFLLFIYALILTQLGDFIGEIHRGQNLYFDWLWLPAICLFMIEPLNQFTFYLANKNREKAVRIKAIVFWSLFTVYYISDILIRLQAEKTNTWVFTEKWPALFFLLILSAILPWYSFCPNIRFFILVGRFRWKEKNDETSK
jgi:hypothetical protein